MISRALGTMPEKKKIVREKKLITGFELLVATPFRTVEVSATPKYENLSYFQCAILFTFSKIQIRFFYLIQPFKEIKWGYTGTVTKTGLDKSGFCSADLERKARAKAKRFISHRLPTSFSHGGQSRIQTTGPARHGTSQIRFRQTPWPLPGSPCPDDPKFPAR